jgi:hypothetical protein
MIYGFSSVAPLGPVAASNLSRYFRSGIGEVGGGRPTSRLSSYFPGHSLTMTSGLASGDPQTSYRRDFCQFSGDGLASPAKAAFVHQVLERDMAEVRIFLDRIEKYTASLSPFDRDDPAVAQALAAIANDTRTRSRYLEFARDADSPPLRVRMLKLALALGWLTQDELRAETVRTIGDTLARGRVTAADVDLACAQNLHHELDSALDSLAGPFDRNDSAHAAVLACLGSHDARTRMLRMLTEGSDGDVQIARVYLRHRPIDDGAELRAITDGVLRMTDPKAQAHALDTLAGLRLSDRASLEALAQLFARSASADVQVAIAGILLRSDYQSIASADLVQTLRQYRRKGVSGDDAIDILIRRVQALL